MSSLNLGEIGAAFERNGVETTLLFERCSVLTSDSRNFFYNPNFLMNLKKKFLE